MKRLLCALIALVMLFSLYALADAGEATWTCAVCGATGRTGQFCSACGAAADTRTCPACGQVITDPAAAFCNACGTRLSHEMSEEDRVVTGLIHRAIESTKDEQSAYHEVTKNVVYATLNKKLATRTGPGTEYEEPGTFYNAGDELPVYSVTYDANGVAWFQTEVTSNGSRMRVYSGLQRLNGVEAGDLRLQIPQNFGVRLKRTCVAYYGPGRNYRAYDFQLSAGTIFTVVEIENGWAMIDYYRQYNQQAYRFWLPMDALTIV